ncbi:MAG: S41 family peptidase, partial [Woeseiaceae bacterium]
MEEFLSNINRVNMSGQDSFSYYDEGGITRYSLTRLDALPDACSAARGATNRSDPELNFDAFWNSFDENYAFFDDRGVDWDAVYEEYRPKVDAGTLSEELYELITEVIRLLDDRHVSLQADNFPRRYSGHPGTLATLLQRELPSGEEATREKYEAAAKEIIARDYLKDSRQQAIDNQFTWGWAAKDIGYLSIDSMADYVDEDTASLRDSHRLVDDTMDRIIRELKGAKGIIVDARWNGGGYDSNALHIAGHLTDQQLLAFTKRARNGETLNPEQDIFIPWYARESFAGPIVYLCGRDTLSAAEIFSMAMMAIPNVTSLGEPTVGALSDTHSVQLPNGWRLTLSN